MCTCPRCGKKCEWKNDAFACDDCEILFFSKDCEHRFTNYINILRLRIFSPFPPCGMGYQGDSPNKQVFVMTKAMLARTFDGSLSGPSDQRAMRIKKETRVLQISVLSLNSGRSIHKMVSVT